MLYVVYTWEDGREEVRYERHWPSSEADQLKIEVEELQRKAREGGYVSPYSIRITQQIGITHDPIRKFGDTYTTAGNSEGI